VAAKYAEAWPAWGHRKIAALMRADSYPCRPRPWKRALRRRGLLLPRGFRADRKSWAAIRRRVFRDPPTERNRVWQMDFSEFETAGWDLADLRGDRLRHQTACGHGHTDRPRRRCSDVLRAAVQHAEQLLELSDLRDDRGEIDLVDETTAN